MKIWLAVTAVAALGMSLASVGPGLAVQPATIVDTVTINALAREAYIWGVAPEFVYRFSRYQELVSAPVNTLKYGNNEAAWNNNATNAGDASVLYLNAFVDFNATNNAPMVLTVPPTDGQYYVANYLDSFVNGIGSIGNRTTPFSASTKTSQSYLLVSPTDPTYSESTTATISGQEMPVMVSDTKVNWLLIRVRADSLTAPSSPTSMASVRTNVEQKFALNTLAVFQGGTVGPKYPSSFANMVPTASQLQQAQVWKSAPTNAVTFFEQVGQGLVTSPLPTQTTGLTGTPMSSLPPQYIPQYGATTTYEMPSYPQQPTLDRFAPIGLTAAGFTIPSGWGARELAALQSGFEAGVSELQTLATAGTASASTNYWSYLNSKIGTYPNTISGYLTRGIVVLDGGSANVPLDAVYPTMNSNDGTGQLDGNNTYSITFTPPASSYASYPAVGIFPPMVKQNGKVAGFWSLIVYQPDATSSSAPFIPQTSVLNTHYSDATSASVVSVNAGTDTITVNAPAWGPIDQSTPMIFGSTAAQYGLQPSVVYYAASVPTQPTASTYAFTLSRTWLQQLSPGGVPIQQSASVGGSAGATVDLIAGASPLTFGLVQPVSQLGSDQLNAGNLATNSDGSVTIWISPTLPAGAAASNWIPTPSTAYHQSLYGASSNVSTSIQAMIRMYYPTPGDTPPSILPLNSQVSTTYVLPALVNRNTSGGGGTPTPQPAPSTSPTTTPSAVPVPVAVPVTAVPSRNPQRSVRPAPGILVLDAASAAKLRDRVVQSSLVSRIGSAPRVQVSKQSPTALVVRNMGPAQDYQVQIKVNGTYRDLGVVRSDSNGALALPALLLSKSGMYPLAVARTDGSGTRYLKLDVA